MSQRSIGREHKIQGRGKGSEGGEGRGSRRSIGEKIGQEEVRETRWENGGDP